jgi:hypothetical protein
LLSLYCIISDVLFRSSLGRLQEKLILQQLCLV